jgi:hypothetical protein
MLLAASLLYLITMIWFLIRQITLFRRRRKQADIEIQKLEENLARTRDAYLSELEKFGRALELKAKPNSKHGVN